MLPRISIRRPVRRRVWLGVGHEQVDHLDPGVVVERDQVAVVVSQQRDALAHDHRAELRAEPSPRAHSRPTGLGIRHHDVGQRDRSARDRDARVGIPLEDDAVGLQGGTGQEIHAASEGVPPTRHRLGNEHVGQLDLGARAVAVQAETAAAQ